jgi:hypothetical protein
MISSIEQDRYGATQQPENLLGRRPVHFPPPVLPSAADLDTYVRLAADEDKIRRLTSK